MANRVDIEFTKGEDVTLQLTVKDAAGVVVNVTGWAASFGVGALTKTGSVVDGPNGRIDITLLDDDTNTLTVGSFPYDVKRTDAGFETVLAYGTLRVLQNVLP